MTEILCHVFWIDSNSTDFPFRLREEINSFFAQKNPRLIITIFGILVQQRPNDAPTVTVYWTETYPETTLMQRLQRAYKAFKR